MAEDHQENEQLIEQKKAELVEKLKSYNILLDQWGKGNAKTLDHLLEEIEAGETVLVEENGELAKNVNVVNIFIFFEDETGRYQLREEKQVFKKDGRIRTRPELESSISEKMKPGEEPLDTLRRGLAEELGITDIPDNVKSLGEKKFLKESLSYPGLKSRHVNYNFELVLPKEQIKPEGYIEEEKDKTNYLRWVRQAEEEQE